MRHSDVSLPNDLLIAGDLAPLAAGSPDRSAAKLIAGSRKRLNQSDRCNRPAEHTQHRRTPDFVARRQLRELAFHDVEIVCGLITAGATHNGRVGGMKE